MICFPNAKINLGLNIVSKRADGYHNLETIFYPILVQDALEVIIKENQAQDNFIQQGIAIDGDSANNLVMKATRLMRKHYSFPSIDIHLLKKIPFGAGIGGGSADASFMLRLLNDTFALGATDQQLAALAVQLGADCPFFVYNRPMFASGIGEELLDVELSLKAYSLVLVKPDVHIATRDAFALVSPRQPECSLLDIIKKPIEDWRLLMYNDFEESVFSKFEIVKTIKDKLYESGALYASMTGSGSSVFAIYRQGEVAVTATDFKNQFFYSGNLT